MAVAGADTFLNDTWKLYFHDPANDNWEFESYLSLATVSSVGDLVDLHRALQPLWANGMFFLMRDHVLPIYEDAHNIRGGVLSFKANKADVPRYWFELAARVLGESALRPGNADAWERVCGISITPKRSFCILRIWVADPDMQDAGLYEFSTPSYTQVMFRSFASEAAEAQAQAAAA